MCEWLATAGTALLTVLLWPAAIDLLFTAIPLAAVVVVLAKVQVGIQKASLICLSYLRRGLAADKRALTVVSSYGTIVS